MSSAFFRRPGEDSSDSSSSEEEDIEELTPARQRSKETTADEEIDLATIESLSSNASISIGDSHDGRAAPELDQYRDLMLATLLEDYYKTRAAEMINANTPGATYHRQSPEIQDLATKLFANASNSLVANGLLPASTTSGDSGNVRQQYLRGLDNFSLRTIQAGDLLPATSTRRIKHNENNLAIVKADRRRGSHEIVDVLEEPMSTLIMQTGRLSISSPHSDMVFAYQPERRGHYESSFQQLRLLGRGGFGKVYHAYNIFDKKEYAVKKIPLSPRLSQRYRESGHQELENVLREVQALAQLDHKNVVRYHATWIEEPKAAPVVSYSPSRQDFPSYGQKLLEHNPQFSRRRVSSPAAPHPDDDDGIVFGDSVSREPSHALAKTMAEWSSPELLHANTTSTHESDIFSDGQARGNTHSSSDSSIDASVYVLHVQMSVYPLTLAQYLLPSNSDASSGVSTPVRRHCFHLVPTLRLLLGILCGLQYIHAKGLVHRDIKPSNIFLTSTALGNNFLSADGFHDVGLCANCSHASPHHVNPRIGDFGLVAEVARSGNLASSPDSFGSSKVVGTEYYRPPPYTKDNTHASSMLKHEKSPKHKLRPKSYSSVDEKLDVFALGVILVEMLWRCSTRSERLVVLKDLQDGALPKGLGAIVEAEGHNPGTSKLVEECIQGMIERNSRERWSCERVKGHVESILSGCRLAETPVHSQGNGHDIKEDGISDQYS